MKIKNQARKIEFRSKEKISKSNQNPKKIEETPIATVRNLCNIHAESNENN